jgi:hypothetical protein
MNHSTSPPGAFPEFEQRIWLWFWRSFPVSDDIAENVPKKSGSGNRSLAAWLADRESVRAIKPKQLRQNSGKQEQKAYYEQQDHNESRSWDVSRNCSV